MTASHRIRGVFFDLGGTLLDFRDPEGWAAIAQSIGIATDPEHLVHSVAEVDRRTDGSVRPTLAAFWQKVLEGSNGGPVPPTAGERFAQAYLARDWPGQLFSDVKRCLDELAREKRRMGVISNSRSEASVRAHLAGSGIAGYFSAVISSGTEGVEKPSRVIFERASRRLGIPPEASFHIGDLAYVDAQAAALAGFQSVWLHRDGTGFGEDPPEITSLTELPGYIRALERRRR